MARTAAETRELLADTALRLFREHGFDATTMRRIAAEAGVSIGNAYHHFAGKDELVQELYVRIQDEHRAVVEPRLVEGAPLADNLRSVLHAGLDVMSPYHGFGQTFLRIAVQPTSSASPFSADSAPARERALGLMRLAVDRSGTKVSPGLGARLPQLLWLTHLAVTLHWVTDTSLDQRRTRTLVDGLCPVVGRAIALSRLPVARGLTDQVLILLDSLSTDLADPATKESVS
ncbi:TetR family transcriptional regulator [Aeromicrobium sp.]|uniref:TetR/AcrR family transcriptional regulator n=1 Tax=Aeromicrobium sp. TaxID=1871063 RepID=UPI0025C09598|nr:TetR family transcriptional regulator [Aeromicrobium sp.]MCK5890928.1 TetR family transcriptional regulator [Aeromicrobium sp.]